MAPLFSVSRGSRIAALCILVLAAIWFLFLRSEWYEYVEYDPVPVHFVNVTSLEVANIQLYESKLRERTLRRLAASVVCKKGYVVTSSGGWCLYPSGDSLAKAHGHADPGLLPTLNYLFKNPRVVDLGAGLGQYGKVLSGLKAYEAYDGALNVEEFTRGYVQWLDMTTPFTLTERADWILCLEVGEHIPAQFGPVFLESVTRNARCGIVISWAVPFQPGNGHVNNQPNSYVIDHMSRDGFRQNLKYQNILRANGTFPWFKNTAMVFEKPC